MKDEEHLCGHNLHSPIASDCNCRRENSRRTMVGACPSSIGICVRAYYWSYAPISIQQILRHSSIAVTMRSYVKTVNADVVSAMAKLEEQLLVPRRFPVMN
jgi:hypothetical protein